MQTDTRWKRHSRVGLAAQGERENDRYQTTENSHFPFGSICETQAPSTRRPLSFEEVFLILIHGKYHFTQIKQAIFSRTILIGFSCKRIIRACSVSLNNFHTFRTLFPLRRTIGSCSGPDSTASAYICYRCQTIQISGWTNGAGELRRAAF